MKVEVSFETANVALAIMQGADVPFSVGIKALRELAEQVKQSIQKKEGQSCTDSSDKPQP